MNCLIFVAPCTAAGAAGQCWQTITLHARFGRDAAHAEWCYGFRLAINTGLGSGIVRTWGIVPAAVSERDAATNPPKACPPPPGLLTDKGFNGKAFAVSWAAAVPACWSRHQGPAARHDPGRSSPSGATGSKPPLARSPT